MSPETWTVLQLVRWAAGYFQSHHIDSPRLAAEILLAHVLGVNRIDLYLQYDKPLNSRELVAFKGFIKRRVKGEPVAYIVGERGFWSLDLYVTPDVLIPRPETEVLVETALAVLPAEAAGSPQTVLDVGTGTGAIVLALASERPGHRFFALDASWRALMVAQKNAQKYGLQERVHFVQTDWLQGITGKERHFDVIVSNPPYVRRAEIDELAVEVSQFEPRKALDGGPDGLDFVKRLVRGAPELMNRQAWLILEIGYDQSDDVVREIQATGKYGAIQVIKDYNGLDRIVRVRTGDAPF